MYCVKSAFFKPWTSVVAAVSLFPMLGISARGAATDVVERNNAAPSLEDLASIPVTSVSRKEQRLRDSAAAVFVITQEDIRRSGARNIPEVLRMVPGLHVARIGSQIWAISARGFNGRFANKMLVLVDGRSAYNSIFSGVYWEAQDTILEDIERIEVIRGPGATMWGANAVNGVISIITKKSRDTQGSLVSTSVGTEGRRSVQMRHGGTLGQRGHYRLFGKLNNYESLHGPNDGWSTRRGGLRTDWFVGTADTLELQTNFYEVNGSDHGEIPALHPPYSRSVLDRALTSGVNVIGRWQRQREGSPGSSIQFYFDRGQRRELLGEGIVHQFNVDAQRHIRRGMHEFAVGGGYRRIEESMSNTGLMRFTPLQFGHNLLSGFFQDQIGSQEDPVQVTLGSKIEHNTYTGAELQPHAQLMWRIDRRSSAWASFGRAVRTPSRFETSAEGDFAAMASPAGIPMLVRLIGSQNLSAEALIASEAGYRFHPVRNVSLDLAAFNHAYTSLRTFEPSLVPVLQYSGFQPYLVSDWNLGNNMSARSYGFETTAHYTVSPKWRLAGSASWMLLDLRLDAKSRDVFSDLQEHTAPRQKVEVRSYYDLGDALEFDTLVYHVGKIAGYNIPAYTRVDLRLGWHLKSRWEISAQAENLLDCRHVEFEPENFGRGRILGRSVGGTITWRF